MLMKVALQTDAFQYEGAHQKGTGREGTVLSFHVILEPTIKPDEGVSGPSSERADGLHWKATVDVHHETDGQLSATSKGYQARGLGRNPIEALDKLADNLRRVADALDKSLEEGITVPIKLHRKRGAEPEEPEEDLDSILAEGS